MQFEKQLSEDRSAFVLVERRDQRAIFLRYPAAEVDAGLAVRAAASRSPIRPYQRIDRPLTEDRLTNDDRAPVTSSADDTSWRAIPTAVSALIAKAAAGVAACADAAFPSFLIVVMSWTFAQALAGCAAYAEAMYPGFVDSDDRQDGRDPVCGTPSRPGDPGQLQPDTPSERNIRNCERRDQRTRPDCEAWRSLRMSGDRCE